VISHYQTRKESKSPTLEKLEHGAPASSRTLNVKTTLKFQLKGRATPFHSYKIDYVRAIVVAAAVLNFHDARG
jgi:hypothetical protein